MALGNLLVSLRATADGYISDLKAMQRENTALVNSVKPVTRAAADIGQAMKASGAVMTAAFTVPLTALGVLSVKAASDFESSFAGVRKTVDATDAEFAVLSQGFRNMAKEIPTSVNELNRIGEAAGQLGISKDNILQFTRTMADLAVTTNLSSDQAATSIAQIQNIFGAAGKDVDRFGATLVALGNKGASTEADIVEMATRIAGAGNIVGLSQAQVLGFATALSDLGIEAQAGGSSISRIFLKIQDATKMGGEALAGFASVAGTSVGDFKKSFEEDAAGATTKFIAGLGRIHAEGGNVNATIEELFGKNIQLKTTLLGTLGAGEKLANHLALANTAWQENTALVNEAAQRHKTFESQLQVFRQRIQDVAITIGQALLPILLKLLDQLKPVIEFVADLAQKFAALPGPVQATAVAIAAVAAAIGPLLVASGLMLTSVSSLAPAFIRVAGLLAGSGGISAAAGTATAAIGGAAGTGGLMGVLTGIGAVLTGPVGITIGIGAAVIALGAFALKNDEVRAAAVSAAGTIKSLASEIATLAAEVAKGVWHGFIDEIHEVIDGLGVLKPLLVSVGSAFKTQLGGTLRGVQASIETFTGSLKGASDRLAKRNWEWQFPDQDVRGSGAVIHDLYVEIGKGIDQTDKWFSQLKPAVQSNATTMAEFRAEIFGVTTSATALRDSGLAEAVDKQKTALNEAAEAAKKSRDELDANNRSIQNLAPGIDIIDGVGQSFENNLRHIEAQRQLIDDTLMSMRMFRDFGVQAWEDVAIEIDKTNKMLEAGKTPLRDYSALIVPPEVKVRVRETATETETAFTKAFKSLNDTGKMVWSQIITDGKFKFNELGGYIKGIFQTLATEILSTMTAKLLNPLVKNITDALSGILGKIPGLSGIFGNIGGGVAGGAGGAAGGAAGGGGGALAGFFTNPWTIGIGAALGAAGLAINKWVGQGRKTADKFVKEFQNPFDDAIRSVHDSFYEAYRQGQLTTEEAEAARDQVEALWSAFRSEAESFARQGENEAKVVSQAFNRVSEVWGSDLGIILGGFDQALEAMRVQTTDYGVVADSAASSTLSLEERLWAMKTASDSAYDAVSQWATLSVAPPPEANLPPSSPAATWTDAGGGWTNITAPWGYTPSPVGPRPRTGADDPGQIIQNPSVQTYDANGGQPIVINLNMDGHQFATVAIPAINRETSYPGGMTLVASEVRT